MPAKSKMAGLITQRDKAVFQFLFESKVASEKQLQKRLFPENKRQTVQMRLGRLARAGWIRKASHQGESFAHPIYTLTEKAYKKYVLKAGSNDREVQLSSGVIDHDLALVDIRALLERRPTVIEVLTENQIQSSKDLAESDEFRVFAELRSDIVLRLSLNEGQRYTIPLEYEKTLKNKDRNQDKLLDYYIKHRGSAVLFVCEDDIILRALAKADQELSKRFKPKLYFSTLENVRAGSENLNFISSNKQKQIVL